MKYLNESNVFLYKLTTDNGGAPCVHDGMLSLCICKPRIRQSAKEGDWIIGFGGKSIPELCNRIIYIAQVESKLTGTAYYSEVYSKRPDCIYELEEDRFTRRDNAKFHDDGDLIHDLGVYPAYDRSRCLVSKRFVYFGNNVEPDISSVKDIYENLPRDFKLNHDQEILERLDGFIYAILSTYRCGSHGSPTNGPQDKCNDIEGGVVKYSCSTKRKNESDTD